MLYDGVAGAADTHVAPPSVVVPESLLAFAGLALAIPLRHRPAQAARACEDGRR